MFTPINEIAVLSNSPLFFFGVATLANSFFFVCVFSLCSFLSVESASLFCHYKLSPYLFQYLPFSNSRIIFTNTFIIITGHANTGQFSELQSSSFSFNTMNLHCFHCFFIISFLFFSRISLSNRFYIPLNLTIGLSDCHPH